VNAWPYLVVIVLLGAMMLFSVRNRRRQAAEETVRVSRIGVGTEVMTTSGLYGTVVARHDDGTVMLAIAPGVEVKWAAAALRDAAALSDAYRRPLAGSTGEPGSDDGAAGASRRPDGDHSSVELRKSGEDGTAS
jgi:preprotein translocase subunit YajC